jgi:GMP synthase-like glutamine amidotransferase
VNHGPLVRSELFGEVILEAGHELVEWHIGFDAPPEGDFEAVLVLGGEMNVGEEPDHPWLEDEYAMLANLVEAELPLFAICLGAQTLAHALGGHVYRLPEQQVGFVEVRLTKAGAADPVLGVLPERFEALVGNSYAFRVPRRGHELATSEVQSQAYRMGDRSWAVQFHPEAHRGQVLTWFEADEKAGTLPKPLPELEAEIEAKIDGWHTLGRKLCLAFLEAAEAAST